MGDEVDVQAADTNEVDAANVSAAMAGPFGAAMAGSVAIAARTTRRPTRLASLVCLKSASTCGQPARLSSLSRAACQGLSSEIAMHVPYRSACAPTVRSFAWTAVQETA